jgi:hypothetical protein
MSFLPEKYNRVVFTTARVIHKREDETDERDWLWVNPNVSHQFTNKQEAETLAELSNSNGSDFGLDISNYPYFVVRVEQENTITEE